MSKKELEQLDPFEQCNVAAAKIIINIFFDSFFINK